MIHALSAAVVMTLAASVPFEQHFAPAENLEAIDVALLDEAGETIDLAAYVLTDLPVIDALTVAAERGVRVRIYRQREEFSPREGLRAAIAALLAAGAEQRFKAADAPLMHLKAYCVDHAAFRFGAANFSHSGEREQDNDLEIARGPHACDAFEAKFEKLWEAK